MILFPADFSLVYDKPHGHTFAVDSNGRLHCFYNRVKAAYCWMEHAGSITEHAVADDLLNWREVGHFTPSRCDTIALVLMVEAKISVADIHRELASRHVIDLK